MKRFLITAGLLVGGLALAACGTSGPGVQARQTGETSTTTAADPATTTAPPSPVAVPELPCTIDALTTAYTAKFGNLTATSLQVQKCVGGWATSAQSHGFDPPSFTLYRAEGDHWVALNRGGGKLCEGQGVPAEVAPQIGCDT